MAKKYAVYQLDKVKGNKEYIPTVKVTTDSLKSAYNVLESWNEDFEEMGIGWYNNKTNEWAAYTIDDRLMYIPNETYVNVDDVLYPKVIGIYGRRPIYYIDEYPCHYQAYKLHRKGDKFTLEGIVAGKERAIKELRKIYDQSNGKHFFATDYYDYEKIDEFLYFTEEWFKGEDGAYGDYTEYYELNEYPASGWWIVGGKGYLRSRVLIFADTDEVGKRYMDIDTMGEEYLGADCDDYKVRCYSLEEVVAACKQFFKNMENYPPLSPEIADALAKKFATPEDDYQNCYNVYELENGVTVNNQWVNLCDILANTSQIEKEMEKYLTDIGDYMVEWNDWYDCGWVVRVLYE